MSTAFGMIVVLAGALVAGCGACGTSSTSVPLPDGGIAAGEEIDAGAGVLSQAACTKYCGPTNIGLAINRCALTPPPATATTIDCYFTNNVMCLKSGKTD